MVGINESARLTFLKWNALYVREKPFQIFVELPEDIADPRTDNLVFESDSEQTIIDVRGREEEFTLDTNGFQFLKHQTSLNAFDTREKIENVYLSEISELLKKVVDGADRVVFFNWRIRRNDPAKEDGEMININDPMQHLLPITQVHIDTSPYSVAQRVIKQFPDEAASLFKGRIRVINVWRPINQPIEDWPLAVCDGSSLRPHDLVRCDHIRPQEQAETTFILRSPQQRWYYMNKQRKDEVVLIKNFDSEPGVAAACCPHVSFEHKNIRPGAPLRESIEARALVFTNVLDNEPVNITATSSTSTDKTAMLAEIKSDPAMLYC